MGDILSAAGNATAATTLDTANGVATTANAALEAAYSN